MKYEKPELANLGFATDAIQGTEKRNRHIDAESLPTVTAYEADE
jgi:hypothetical protein